jgi:hypothetical protein
VSGVCTGVQELLARGMPRFVGIHVYFVNKNTTIKSSADIPFQFVVLNSTFSNFQATACQMCLAGYYPPTPDVLECVKCQPGTYSINATQVCSTYFFF